MSIRCKYKILGVVVVFLLVVCAPILMYGQPGNPDPPGEPVPLPGIGILIALGGALGGYSIFRKSRNQD